jgi:hypothetical protein
MAEKDKSDIQQDLLMREVDEELRREQLKKLWERYGTYVIAAAALIVLGVGGYKFWQAREIDAREQAGKRFAEARRLAADGKAEDARKAFAEIGKSGPTGYAALAQLSLAGAHVKAGRTAEAVAAFEAAARQAAGDPIVAGFARLQAAALRSGDADWTEMENRLNDLTVDSSPWRHGAIELLGLTALKAGKMDEARRRFEVLVGDPKAPAALGQRAQIAMGEIVAAELALKAASPSPAKQ